MPLGLAKDSMLNLAELASKTDDEARDGSHSNGDGDVNSYTKHACLEDYFEGQQQSKRETNVNSNAAMVGSLEAPIRSRIASDEKNSTEDITSLSAELENNLSFRDISNTQQYAGFQADYHDFESYTSHNFSGNDATSKHGGRNKNKDDNPWWHCFAPWLSSQNDYAGKEHSSGTDDITQNEEEGPSTKTADSNDDDDEISPTGAERDDELGETPLQKDRQTLLATSQSGQQDETKDQGAGEDGSTVAESSFRKKSIIKFPSRGPDYGSLSTQSTVSNGSKLSSTQPSRRRALFPAYEPKSVKKNLSTSFSPLAGVVKINSTKDMSSEEKSCIWWQKPDYDEFRKTGRMISRVMLQGGSEIWLATNQSWQLPNQGRAATLRRAMANVDNEDASDKWWHKFGHSRRGLEHIASIDEGRQRHANVKTSRRAILTEQRRQKAFHREDPEKLRMCSIQNTSWAKDLALASGASDADAVSKNFDEENRKSREFYLLKFSHAGKLNSTSGIQSGTKQIVPAFMKPMISMQLRPNRLDANTITRLKFKKKEAHKASTNLNRDDLDLPAIIVSGVGEVTAKTVTSVPIHDPAVNVPERESLASKAAGFANGEEAVNMSAVLAGMGPIPKKPDATRARPILA